MFEHLVESGSHAQDVKRKGSFLLAFTGVYIVLGVAFFIVGILWYNAQLDVQNLELTALIAPVPAPPAPKTEEAPKPEKVEINKNVDVRKELIADVSRAEIVPEKVQTKASDIPPVRRGVATVIGSGNTNAIAPVAPGAGGTGTGAPTGPAKVDINHASGAVQVQVLIDENGNVISAHAVSGHPLLQAAAVSAARSSKFTPTKLSGQPVKVNGVIIYNFVAQ